MNKITVIVDMQLDFLFGSLPVPGGQGIVEPIIKICKNSDLVIATRDWHPHDHSSFLGHGGSWPIHCVRGTTGAELVSSIDIASDVIISKGTNKFGDAYSAADNPAFIPFIKSVTSPDDLVVVCGVALDYCVQATAFDIIANCQDLIVKVPGYATASVDQDPISQVKLIRRLSDAGIIYERDV